MGQLDPPDLICYYKTQLIAHGRATDKISMWILLLLPFKQFNASEILLKYSTGKNENLKIQNWSEWLNSSRRFWQKYKSSVYILPNLKDERFIIWHFKFYRYLILFSNTAIIFKVIKGQKTTLPLNQEPGKQFDICELLQDLITQVSMEAMIYLPAYLGLKMSISMFTCR